MGKIKETSTNNINKQYIIECDTPYAISQIGGRWKLLILCQLEGGKSASESSIRVFVILPNEC